ncbi:PDR/VanB family oxidoreductase [Rhodococcus sp. ACS1]|uniref:PDR/VanB family oxidoreductase n=1 Tax=Rhodococcus sp. ACS1 TaxID=2028570 RepID=UPI0027BA4A96|nr:PDR/VanB family oxidoreductase [Rhodococcus sp. ACS1]
MAFEPRSGLIDLTEIPAGSHGSRFVVDTFVKPGTDPEVLGQWLDVYDRTFDEDKTVVAAQQGGYDSGAVPQGRLMTNCESTIAMFQRRTWQAMAATDTTVRQHPEPQGRSASVTDGPASPPVSQRTLWEAGLVVEAVEPEADGVASLTLTPPAGVTLPAWEPGAHIDLCLTDSLTRQYSLCGDPHDHDRWRVAVLREPRSRGGSAHVHDHIAAGASIRVRGPRNHFRMPDAESYVFVAGGIGITPILPMIEDAERRAKPWKLLYGGRTRSSMAFLSHLERHGDKVLVSPQDTDGLLDLEAFLGSADPGTTVLACGPAPLLDALATASSAVDLTLQTERFSAPTQHDEINTAFDVVLARTGDILHVLENRSILDVVREHGVPVLSSCREGLCGTCETPVLEGRPEHRDTVLTDDERERGDTMMICVSRCTSDRLVLDL